MQDYKPNSHRFKESQGVAPASAAVEKKKPEKVISGTATVKPKGEIAKLIDIFIVEDFRKVKDFLIKDYLIPTVKDAIWTMIARGSERLLYGEVGHTPKNSKLGHINYNNLFKQATSTPGSGSTSDTNSQFNVDNIILDNRGDAERVLYAMKGYIDTYGAVSISDLYQFIDRPIGDYTTTRWGWRSLNGAGVIPLGVDAYKLDLPRAISLK